MPRLLKAMGGTKLATKLATARSLIKQLARDTAGNTLGIALATIILLVSLAGSGTDTARAYMTKTSLQNACDAGVLAGRKAMAISGTYGTSETARANKMFNFNFNPNATNASSITFNTASNGTGAITGTATTTMPTVIMGIFGFKSINLTVACSAELQMASADVMFVLDTTGSMRCQSSQASCSSDQGALSKMQGLRDAVRDFYKTVAGAVVDKTNTRIRFGFVPYSSTVNLKELISTGAMPTSYFSDLASYNTRLAFFNTPVSVGTADPPSTTTETYGSDITSAQCTSYGTNSYPSAGSNPVSSGTAPANTTSTSYSFNTWTKTGSSTVGKCTRKKTVTTTKYVTRYQFTNWSLNKRTLNLAAFKGMGSVPIASTIASNATVPNAGYYDMPTLGGMVGQTGVTGITNENVTWDGCMEERATAKSLTMSPVPSGATDLDLENAPTDDSTSWKPLVDELSWFRQSYTPWDLTDTDFNYYWKTKGYIWRMSDSPSCPAPAKQFTDVDTTDPTVVPKWLDDYVKSLTPNGGTYHDVGMIWGGRMANPTGMFEDNVTENSTKYPSVSRHIIFMTDGAMDPSLYSQTAYGTEYYDNRVAPAGTPDNAASGMVDYHNARFLAVCSKVKNLGYTVWVIGFGTALTTQMQSCATAGRAYQASNPTALNNTFKFIAGQVADLRINK